MSRSYQDFEPENHYRKGEVYDIIEFQVKDFSKDQLKVHLSGSGILTVAGERPHEGTKWIRFRKEFNPPNDCKPKDIRARFSSGILYITIPKTVAPQLPRQQEDPPTPVQQPLSSNHQDKGKLKQESSLKEVAGTGNLKTTSPNENSTLPKAGGTKSFISRLKMTRKTAVNVVASVTVLSLLFTVLFYVHKSYGPMIINA